MKPWEYRPVTIVAPGRPTPSGEDVIAELLHRYYLGEFTPQVRQRLANIFQECPSDATERLLKAAEYLKVDGTRLEHFAELATQVATGDNANSEKRAA